MTVLLGVAYVCLRGLIEVASYILASFHHTVVQDSKQVAQLLLR